MSIQEARRAAFEKFLAEQRKWIEEKNLEPLTATEIGSMMRAWNAALDSVVLDLTPANIQHSSYHNINCYAISDIQVLAQRAGIRVEV